MNKVELLAPAGDLEKLKIAYLYGADACYIGGKKFSLRARASNFTLDDIKEAALIASNLNKKLYITMNIIPHEDDLNGLIDYLKKLDEYHVTGIIVSSLTIVKVCKEVCPNLEIHISTQNSVLNSEAIKYYSLIGATRVVLAREASLDNIKLINENIQGIKSNSIHNKQIETEVFIHGGMCSSFSGRCMLSNYLTNRDANRGGCAHSCRWNYDIYDNKDKLSGEDYFSVGSKDLNSITLIPKLIESGASSLKIEGRMKSLYYIASVVRCYRMIIDDYYNNKTIDYNYYINEINKAENRITSTGFLNTNATNPISKNEQLYSDTSVAPTKDFLGIVLDYDEMNSIVSIEQRNIFYPHDKIEFFGPNLKNTVFELGSIFDNQGREFIQANHPLDIVRFQVPFKLNKFDMMRRI